MPASEPWSTFSGAWGGTVTFRWAPSPIMVAENIDAAASYLNNMHLPLAASRQLSIADVEENFAGQHDPDGAAWVPWSASYMASGPPGPPSSILTLGGSLRGAATSPGAWPITAREVFFNFGALPEYGIWHQEGASRASGGKGVSRKKNVRTTRGFKRSGFTLLPGRQFYGQNDLPARPFAGISEETQMQIIEVFDGWFGGAVGLALSSSGAVQYRSPTGRFGSRV